MYHFRFYNRVSDWMLSLLQSHDSWQGHDSDQVSIWLWQGLRKYCTICTNTLLRISGTRSLCSCSFARCVSHRPHFARFFRDSMLTSARSFRNLHVDVLVSRVNATFARFPFSRLCVRPRKIFRAAAERGNTNCTPSHCGKRVP